MSLRPKPTRVVDLVHGYRRMGRSPRTLLARLRGPEPELVTRLKAATRERQS